jgi:hypothetical protein
MCSRFRHGLKNRKKLIKVLLESGFLIILDDKDEKFSIIQVKKTILEKSKLNQLQPKKV